MDKSVMVDSQRYNTGMATPKNNAKRNGGGDRSKISGNRPDASKGRTEMGKSTKSKNNRRNLAGTSDGTKTSRAARQDIESETPKASNNGKGAKPKMVDSCMQTSTPLRLHLDGMLAGTAVGYQRPCLLSPESETTEYDEDGVTSDIGGDSCASTLSSRRTSTCASFSSKDLDYHVKYYWAQSPGRQQLLLHDKTPRCLQDLESLHEQKLIRMTKQLNELVSTLGVQ